MLPISRASRAILRFHAHDQVELFFALDHLGGRLPADGRLDDGFHVGHVDSVAGDLCAVDVDQQAGLAQFADHGHFGEAGHFASDFLISTAFFSQPLQVGAEDLHGQGALQAGQRLIHGVFRRLGVIENDAGKRLEFF